MCEETGKIPREGKSKSYSTRIAEDVEPFFHGLVSIVINCNFKSFI